jgi:hypothetical protein
MRRPPAFLLSLCGGPPCSPPPWTSAEAAREPEAATAVGYDYAEQNHDEDVGAGAVAENVYDGLDREYKEAEPQVVASSSPTTYSTKCPFGDSKPICELQVVAFFLAHHLFDEMPVR